MASLHGQDVPQGSDDFQRLWKGAGAGGHHPVIEDLNQGALASAPEVTELELQRFERGDHDGVVPGCLCK